MIFMRQSTAGVNDAVGVEDTEGWQDAFAAEPALVELVLLGFAGVCIYFLVGRVARLVADARSRRGVHDYLLGVEQALAHDARGAAQRLRRVLDEDPENRAARLLYGLVLADLGDPAEAHQQHLELHVGFDESSRRNDLALAENLIAVACPADAIEHAERAVDKSPGRVDGLRVLFRAQLTAGVPSAAARTGRRLMALLPSGEERSRVRQDVADALCLAGEVKLDADDVAGANQLLAEASGAEPDAQSVQRLRARLAWREKGEAMLLSESSEEAGLGAESGGTVSSLAESRSLPALSLQNEVSPYAVEVTEPARNAGLQLLTDLGSKAPYRCERCSGSLEVLRRRCSHCGAEDSVVAAEPDLLNRVDAPSHLVDAIEENDAHITRLLDRIGAADAMASEELEDIGARAVEQTLRRALACDRESGVAESVYIEILQGMGAAVLPDLFAAYEGVGSRHARGSERSRVAQIVGRVVQGYDHEAVPVFEKLLGTDDPDLRKILIDYFLGLADPIAFDTVLEHFPPVEVIHRLNDAPLAILSAFVVKLESGSFLVEVVLPDPVFVRDEVLLDAVPEAAESATLIRILERRGFSRSMTRTAIERLAEPALQKTCHQLLDGYGREALEHQIASFVNLDEKLAVRAELADRFAREGSAVVGKLCDCFGTGASPVDEALLEVLVRIGSVDPLVEAYSQGGLLEKFAQRFRQRHVHRRCMILRALGGIANEAARASLVSLRRQEKDKDLELRLSRAIHLLDSGEGHEA